MSNFSHSLWFHHILLIFSEVKYLITTQQSFKFLPSPPSIIIFLCRPFFTVFWFSCIFYFNFFGTCRNFSSWLAAHEFILTRIFSHYFLGGVIFHILWHPPLATLLLDALPLCSVFLHLHCFVVSYPSCTWILLEMAFECMLHHSSKCNPYPVQSMCIHWLHIANPIILPVHDRTSNFGFCIFPKCDTCTCEFGTIVHKQIPWCRLVFFV